MTPGYYLVKDKDGSVSGQDSADYDIGDAVPFQLTGTVAQDYNDYKGAYQLVFHDTLSNGLTFNASSVKVYVNDSTDPVDADKYTITNPTADGHSFDVTIHDVKSLGTDVSKVRVEYTAELNENAVIGSLGNPNKMYMEFSNNPNNEQGGDKGQTPEDKVIVFTYKVVINKIDSRRIPLAGAAFKLEKVFKDGTKKVVKEYTIGADENDLEKTKFEFTGLDDGQYILTETVAPEGYNTMDPITFNVIASHDTASADPKLTDLNGNPVNGEIEFTANKDKATLTAAVVNYQGDELPSTGGMGTTILYAAGVILILAAGAFLVMQKKAENK